MVGAGYDQVVITVSSHFAAQRSRAVWVLWRVLGLGLLLFGLLYSHAVSLDAAASHLAPGQSSTVTGADFEPTAASEVFEGAASVPSVTERSGVDRHQGHGQHHADVECALGQPMQGPNLTTPCLSPLGADASDDWQPLLTFVQHAAQGFVAPTRPGADSAILRI